MLKIIISKILSGSNLQTSIILNNPVLKWTEESIFIQTREQFQNLKITIESWKNCTFISFIFLAWDQWPLQSMEQKCLKIIKCFGNLTIKQQNLEFPVSSLNNGIKFSNLFLCNFNKLNWVMQYRKKYKAYETLQVKFIFHIFKHFCMEKLYTTFRLHTWTEDPCNDSFCTCHSIFIKTWSLSQKISNSD